jgi:hypothetical protein
MRNLQVPVIVTVGVTVNDDGTPEVEYAHVDNDGGPWPYSGDVTLYDTDTYEWYEQGRWTGDDVESVVAALAYDHMSDLINASAWAQEGEES